MSGKQWGSDPRTAVYCRLQHCRGESACTSWDLSSSFPVRKNLLLLGINPGPSMVFSALGLSVVLFVIQFLKVLLALFYAHGGAWTETMKNSIFTHRKEFLDREWNTPTNYHPCGFSSSKRFSCPDRLHQPSEYQRFHNNNSLCNFLLST